jgi:hypothetical protein
MNISMSSLKLFLHPRMRPRFKNEGPYCEHTSVGKKLWCYQVTQTVKISRWVMQRFSQWVCTVTIWDTGGTKSKQKILTAWTHIRGYFISGWCDFWITLYPPISPWVFQVAAAPPSCMTFSCTLYLPHYIVPSTYHMPPTIWFFFISSLDQHFGSSTNIATSHYIISFIVLLLSPFLNAP